MKVPSSEDNIVSAVLWNKLNTFHVILLNEFPKVSIYHLLSDSCFVLGQVWNFKEHTGGHVNAVKHLQVNMKVRWYVSLFLLDFFLKSLLLLSGEVASALGERFLQLW